MTKQIFSEEESVQPHFSPKQEFTEEQVEMKQDRSLFNEDHDTNDDFSFEEKPNRFWIRLLLAAIVLFAVAIVAQSVQWLYDSVQNRQWIEFAFALVLFLISLVGGKTLFSEWQKLRRLRQHQFEQQQSQQLRQEALQGGEKARIFCETTLKQLAHLPAIKTAEQRYRSQVNEAHNAQEVFFLFNENVLSPLDKQAQRLIMKNATENAILVGVSPLAVVDVLLVAWRNFALVNQLSRLYGMELGYVSRLSLFKMVLKNMAFAGATEAVTDMGMEFLSQHMLARLSLRAVQGIGVGVLTVRLGLKAMAFCRPMPFEKGEQPKLSEMRQALLAQVSQQFFSKNSEKSREFQREIN